MKILLGMREKFVRSALGIFSVASIVCVLCAMISLEIGKGIYVRKHPDTLQGGHSMKELQPHWGNSFVFHEVVTIVASFVLPVSFIMTAQQLYQVFSINASTLKVFICVNSVIWMILLTASSARFIEQMIPDPEYQYRILRNTSVFISDRAKDNSNIDQWNAFVTSAVFGMLSSGCLAVLAVLCILDLTGVIELQYKLNE